MARTPIPDGTPVDIQPHVVGSLRFVTLDNLYTEAEMVAIGAELRSLMDNRQVPRNTSTATDENGNLLKKGSGVFLDAVYRTNRFDSAILNANRKLFFPLLNEQLCEVDASYRHIKESTIENTLVNYYGDGDEYLPHRDMCTFTAVTMFSLGEFAGGKFLFPEHEIALDHVDGRVIIFPSCVLHAVERVTAAAGNYRVTTAQLIGYRG